MRAPLCPYAWGTGIQTSPPLNPTIQKFLPRKYPEREVMIHLKQHVFNSATAVCIYCGVDLQDRDLPCDHALDSAPDYFDHDDPRWQAAESENALRPVPDEK